MSKLEDTFHRVLKLKRARQAAEEARMAHEKLLERMTAKDNAVAAARLKALLAQVRGAPDADTVKVSVSKNITVQVN